MEKITVQIPRKRRRPEHMPTRKEQDKSKVIERKRKHKGENDESSN